MPSTVDSANGSKDLSGRHMKLGFRIYLERHKHRPINGDNTRDTRKTSRNARRTPRDTRRLGTLGPTYSPEWVPTQGAINTNCTNPHPTHSPPPSLHPPNYHRPSVTSHYDSLIIDRNGVQHRTITGRKFKTMKICFVFSLFVPRQLKKEQLAL